MADALGSLYVVLFLALSVTMCVACDLFTREMHPAARWTFFVVTAVSLFYFLFWGFGVV